MNNINLSVLRILYHVLRPDILSVFINVVIIPFLHKKHLLQ